MKHTTILAGGAVATALVLAAGAVTVAGAVGTPVDSSRVLDDHGIDTVTVSPTPMPGVSRTAMPEPGDDGQHGVVTVPPAGPTIIDRHGDETVPDDDQGADDQSADDHGADGHGQHAGDDDGQHRGEDSGDGQGDDNGGGHR